DGRGQGPLDRLARGVAPSGQPPAAGPAVPRAAPGDGTGPDDRSAVRDRLRGHNVPERRRGSDRVAGLAVHFTGRARSGNGGLVSRKETARTVAWIGREHEVASSFGRVPHDVRNSSFARSVNTIRQ